MSLGDTIIHCGLVGLSFCRSCVSFLFLVWLLQPPPCSVYAGSCPLMGLCLVLWWSEPTLDTGRAPTALWLLLPWQAQGLLPRCQNRGPQICVWAAFLFDSLRQTGPEHSHWERGRTGALPLGEGSLRVPLLKLFTCESTLLCHLTPTVQLFKVHWKYTQSTLYFSTALSPTSTMGRTAIVPDVSQALFSQDQTHRSQVPGLC